MEDEVVLPRRRAERLGSLIDVSGVPAADGQVLVWNGGDRVWQPGEGMPDGTPDPTPDTLVMRDADGGASLTTLGLTAPSGTAPLMVESSTLVANLNADTVDGKHASELGVSATTALTPTSITLTGIRDMVSIFGLAAGTYLFLATGEVRNDSTTAGDYLDVAFALDISEEESDPPPNAAAPWSARIPGASKTVLSAHWLATFATQRDVHLNLISSGDGWLSAGVGKTRLTAIRLS